MLRSPYAKSLDYFIRDSQQSNSKVNFYQLVGIAKQDTRFLQIYQHYFSEIYKKQKDKIVRLQFKHLSIFFIAFLNISILKNAICSYYNITEAIRETINDILRPDSDAKLVAFIKETVNVAYEHQYRALLNFNAGKSCEISTQGYIKSAMKISVEIDKIIESVVSKITNDFDFMKEHETIPSGYNSRQFVKHIRNNFAKIKKLHMPRYGLREKVFNQFNSINRYNFPLLFVIKEPKLGFENQRFNSFTLPKYSRQTQEILTKMIDFLPRPHPHRELLKNIKFQAIKLIFDFCCNYHRISQSTYPIALNDLYVDQKSLKTVASQAGFIKDAIGIKGNIKNTELLISTELTPNSLMLQECHLQMQQFNLWLLLRKYYHPRTRIYGVSNEEQSQRLKVIDQKQPQIRKFQKELSENIHVWRIIGIMYFIMHRKHMNNVLYLQYYDQVTKIKTEYKEKPFYQPHYKQVLEYLYLQIAEGKIKIADLFKPKGDEDIMNPSQIADQKTDKFDFTLSSLGRQLKIQEEDDDSMIQDLRMHQLKTQIYERNVLIEEIQAIIFNRKLFKKMNNAIKYMLVFYLNLHQELYFKAIIKKKEEEQGKTQSQIMSMLEGGINGVNLIYQGQKRRNKLKSIKEKIDSYQQRNDSNGDYFKNNPVKYQDFISCIQQYEKIIQLSGLYDSIAAGSGYEVQRREQLKLFLAKIEKLEVQYIRIYQEQILMKIIKLKQELQKRLTQHFQTEVERVISLPNSLHKVSDFKNVQTCLYFNQKLSNTMKLYLNLNEHNWKRLYMKALMNIRQVQTQRVDSLSKADINSMINKLKMIRKFINNKDKQRN